MPPSVIPTAAIGNRTCPSHTAAGADHSIQFCYFCACPYAGIVSSGTFTHGHVGPDVLGELLRVARPGAQFAISINAGHFVSHGFEDAFAALGDRITGLKLPETRIYGPDADDDHKDDLALIALFQKG